MDDLNTLQKFVVTWMDELWWSMRDRVGALSMIECLSNSWRAAGREAGELARRSGLTSEEATARILSILGRDASAIDGTVKVTKCPLWDRICEGSLEYAFKCEEFTCAPLLAGLKEGLGAREMTVETSMRINHVNRARLEYKISKLKSADTSDPLVKEQYSELEKQLGQLSTNSACIFHIK
jgi:hypothetical protein